jgi:hypothetical protein
LSANTTTKKTIHPSRGRNEGRCGPRGGEPRGAGGESPLLGEDIA